jgi:hypothetical protein
LCLVNAFEQLIYDSERNIFVDDHDDKVTSKWQLCVCVRGVRQMGWGGIKVECHYQWLYVEI